MGNVPVGKHMVGWYGGMLIVGWMVYLGDGVGMVVCDGMVWWYVGDIMGWYSWGNIWVWWYSVGGYSGCIVRICCQVGGDIWRNGSVWYDIEKRRVWWQYDDIRDDDTRYSDCGIYASGYKCSDLFCSFIKFLSDSTMCKYLLLMHDIKYWGKEYVIKMHLWILMITA